MTGEQYAHYVFNQTLDEEPAQISLAEHKIPVRKQKGRRGRKLSARDPIALVMLVIASCVGAAEALAPESTSFLLPNPMVCGTLNIINFVVNMIYVTSDFLAPIGEMLQQFVASWPV